jgi:phosphate transport system substrate-binding protein
MLSVLFVGLLSTAQTIDARAGAAPEINGAGSTFVAPIITKWADDYAKVSDTKLAYQAVGSGAGIERIRSGAVDFGATDQPLAPTELEKAGLFQFPIVIGGIVPVVNLPGVKSGRIRFTRQLLVDIYLGAVTTWDAAEVRAVNPDLSLPALPIMVVHRSDASGTTYNWVDFLSKISAAWKEKIGVGLSVDWPVGIGKDGNAGVAATVMQTTGAIGYVEYSYALENELSFGLVENAHNLFIAPNPDSFQSAASTVDWQRHKDFSVLMTDAGAPDAFPIAATTFILMYKSSANVARSAATLAFFKWALEEGADQASATGYAELPPNLILKIESYWAASTDIGLARSYR